MFGVCVVVVAWRSLGFGVCFVVCGFCFLLCFVGEGEGETFSIRANFSVGWPWFWWALKDHEII
jgi:hypothetical protein